MRLFGLVRRPFRTRRLRWSRPLKVLSLQDKAGAAQVKAEGSRRRLSAEQEENRRQAVHLQQRETGPHSTDVELVALRRTLAVLAPTDYEAVYTLSSPELDPDGSHLFRTAGAYTGINIYSAFPVENSLGYFEVMNGHGLLRWLEAKIIGSYSLGRLPPGIEVTCDLRMDQSGEKYRRYHEEICKLIAGKLLCME